MPCIEKTVAIVGTGSMGAAIAAGLADTGTCDPSCVLACDHNAGKLEALSSGHGVTTYPDAESMLAAGPDVVVLAVKPQVLPAFVSAHADQLASALVVSIAAGVSIASLEALLGEARVVRVMPNLPIAAGSGASAVARGTHATDDDLELVVALFSAMGCAHYMREDQLDVEGAVIGCAPAYFALMVDALTRAGIKAGLPAATCRDMVNATMGGVAAQLADGDHPRAYMERVTSPGGTTAAALYELEPLLQEGAYLAVDAALARTRELAGD